MSDDKVKRPAGVEVQQVITEQPIEIKQTKEDREQSQALKEYRSQKAATAKQTQMHIKVYSPYRDYYDGQAFSISAANETGAFDILPQHHNFISLLSPCELVLRTVDQGEQRIRISGGIMHVKADEVIVFLDV